jgi:hypothetical protein
MRNLLKDFIFSASKFLENPTKTTPASAARFSIAAEKARDILKLYSEIKREHIKSATHVVNIAKQNKIVGAPAKNNSL